jgi:outer membrane protein assembly factor BamB
MKASMACLVKRWLVWAAGICLTAAAAGAAEDWPFWRGPRGDGTSADENAPVHWSGQSNVVWRVPVPGTGHASPVVVGDRIWTVSALLAEQQRVLLCWDTSGKLLWQTAVLESPLERKHNLNSYASSTPASDGTNVFVAFLDRNEMVVGSYSPTGSQRWLVRPGPFQSMHGFCSSPLWYRDLVLVNGDHDGESYLVALDRVTGRTRWKTMRQNKTRSYCVPLVRTIAGRAQMILTGDKSVASYDPATGALHWIMDGPTEQFVASPVYSEKTGLVYVTGGYPEHHILAIRPDGTGDVTRTHIVWRTNRGAAYVPSPIIEKDFFLVISDSGVAHCFEAATGKLLWQERMGEHHASLISARGLVYFLNDDGVMHVVRPGPEFELVARNPLEQKCFASPALSRGRLYLRGERELFCIAEGGPEGSRRAEGRRP